MTTPDVIPRGELSNLRMAAGNEKKFTVVIDDRTVKEWVGIGWVDLRRATADDIAKYPRVGE